MTDTILALESELRSAMFTNDVATLNRLLDDALVFTSLDGSVIGKEWDLAAHRARRLRLTRMDPSDVHIVRCGSTAVVSVRMDIDGTWDGGPATGVFRYTRVWCE